MFTKKHYEAIASVLYNVDCHIPIDSKKYNRVYSGRFKQLLIEALCVMFEEDNPNFDRERFILCSDMDGDMML
jgi:hypothetical protein